MSDPISDPAPESSFLSIAVSPARRTRTSSPRPAPRTPESGKPESASWALRAYSTEPQPGDRERDAAYLRSEAPRLIDWFDGSRFYLLPDEDLSRAIARTGTYEPETFAFLRRATPAGGVFMDVGANSGAYTVAASRWVAEHGVVIAVEPSVRERRKLDRNLVANGAANVYVWPFPLGAQTEAGRLAIGSGRRSGLNTLADTIAWDAPIESRRAVLVHRLDDLVHLPRLDVIKADVEGAEPALLRGARRTIERLRPVIVLELGLTTLKTYGSSIDELGRVLRLLDYAPHRILEDGGLAALDRLEDAADTNIAALPRERSRAAGGRG